MSITIEYLDETEDVFDITVEDNHNFFANGILVHNCTEIALRNDPNVSFVCNLASVNLANIDLSFDHETGKLAWSADLERVVRTLTRGLDNVVTVGTIPHERGTSFQEQDRAVGLGVMGWTVALYKLGINYESDEHLQFANEVYKQISATAIHESASMAQDRGPYDTFRASKWAKGELPIDSINMTSELASLIEQTNVSLELEGCPFAESWDELGEMVAGGMRNSCLMAIAPTATIANIMGTTQCTEMPWDLASRKENLSGEFTSVSPVVMHNKFDLPLKAARDIDHQWTVCAAAMRQLWIDQSQSTNFFINPVAMKAKYGESYLSEIGRKLDELYTMSWALGVKTTYYVYSQAPDVSALIVNSPGPMQEFDEAVDGPACFLRPGDPGFSDCEACQ